VTAVAILALLVLACVLVVGIALGGTVLALIRRCRADIARESVRLGRLIERVEQLEERLSAVRPAHVGARPEARAEEAAAPGVPAAAPAPTALPAQAAPVAPQADRWASLEDAVGKRWITWAGVLAFFVGAGFFVKYTFDRGWLGPAARVVLGIAAGLVMLGLGTHALKRTMRALGQGLLGGGLAILYVSLYAGYSRYGLIPQVAAFGMMVVVTASGVGMAIAHDSLPVSVLAVIGGILTPVLVSSGNDARDALFAYLALLDLGVLAATLLKRWRALDVLAFVGTAALFAGWYGQFYSQAAMLPTLWWLAAFFLVFLLFPLLDSLRRKEAVPFERLLMALANAALAFACAHAVLERHRHTLGAIALGMGACYLALGAVSRRRVPADGEALFGFVAVAVCLLTASVPLELERHGITAAWAVEGPVLLYLGYRFRYFPVRAGGLLIVGLAALRVFAVHWPLHLAPYVPFLNRPFAAAFSVPLAAAVYAVVHHLQQAEAAPADRRWKAAAAIFAVLLAAAIVDAEIGLWIGYRLTAEAQDPRSLRAFAAVLVWSAAAAGLLYGAVQARSRAAFLAGLAALLVAAGVSVHSYLIEMGGPYPPFLTLRFLSALVVGAVTLANAVVRSAHPEVCPGLKPPASAAFYAAAALWLASTLSAEAYGWSMDNLVDPLKAHRVAQMMLSIVWGLYASAALAVGFWRKARWLRLSALGLFAVAAAKLVLVDISMTQLYRVISFVALGALMIATSYLYHRAEKMLDRPGKA
jgi:uncharacterized membrane protein